MRSNAGVRAIWKAGFVAGVFGGLVMVLVQGIARLGARIPMFPDLFADLATKAIPPAVFSKVLDTLLFQAKPLLFVSLVVGQIAVSGILGIIFALRWGKSETTDGRWSGWQGGWVFGLAAWVITAVVLLPIAGQGMFGSATTDGPILLNLALIAEFLIFGLTIAASYHFLTLDQREALNSTGARDPGRRRLIGGALAGSAAVLTAGTLYRIIYPGAVASPGAGSKLVASGSAPPTPLPNPTSAASAPSTATIVPTPAPAVASAATTSSPAPTLATAAVTPDSAVAPTVTTAPEWTINGLAPEVTSTADFYAVSKNLFSDPTVDAGKWTLQVLG